jgi:hypothetical protein
MVVTALVVAALAVAAGATLAIVGAPAPSVAADASTTTTADVSGLATSTTIRGLASSSTTTTTIPCVIPLNLYFKDVPSTLTPTAQDQGSVYRVPVGSVFVVHLADGDRCAGPQWLAPVAGPSTVVAQIATAPTSTGATASASFVVVGAGQGTIVFPGTCGSLPNCTAHADWGIRIEAMPFSATTTTLQQLPTTS